MPGKKRSPLLVWSVLLIALAAGGFLVWRLAFNKGPQRPDMAGMDAPPVRASRAVTQNVPYFLNGLGTVAPSGDVLVQSRVDGQLIAIHFKEGQRVKAGDLLAEIDPRPYQAALEQARGALARDRAQLQNAQRDLTRYAKLAKGDFIAGQQYESQKALVTQYQGTVESDKAAVDSAALQVEYSRITAPISGRLGLKTVDVGNQIKANDPEGIVRITENEPSDVIFTLPESRLPLVMKALRAREKEPNHPPVIAQAWDRERKELLAIGELLSIDNQIDSSTGTVRLKARFPNKERRLFPNQFVNIRLLVDIIKNAVTVLQAGVQLGSKGSYCYIVKKDGENDIAEFRSVVPGITDDGIQIIDKGVESGELIVVDGVDRLRDNIPIRVTMTVPTPIVSEENLFIQPAPSQPEAAEIPPANAPAP